MGTLAPSIDAVAVPLRKMSVMSAAVVSWARTVTPEKSSCTPPTDDIDAEGATTLSRRRFSTMSVSG